MAIDHEINEIILLFFLIGVGCFTTPGGCFNLVPLGLPGGTVFFAPFLPLFTSCLSLGEKKKFQHKNGTYKNGTKGTLQRI